MSNARAADSRSCNGSMSLGSTKYRSTRASGSIEPIAPATDRLRSVIPAASCRARRTAPARRRPGRALCVDSRRPDLDGARRHRDLARPGEPIAHHQPTAILAHSAACAAMRTATSSSTRPPASAAPVPHNLIRAAARSSRAALSPTTCSIGVLPADVGPSAAFLSITWEGTPRPPSGLASTTLRPYLAASKV